MKNYIKFALIGLLSFSQVYAQGPSCDELMQKISGSHGSPAVLKLLIPELAGLKIDCSNPAAAEQEVFAALWELEASNKLDSSISLLVKAIRKENIIPAINNVSDELIEGTLSLAVKSELFDRGFYNKAFQFVGWGAITSSQEKLLRSIPKVYSFKSAAFRNVFKKLTNMEMTNVSNTEVLGQNGRALSKRIEIIRGAKSSIKLATWGFYDDSVGRKFADELIAASKKGISVQVIVDYQVSQRPGYKNELQRMSRSGVEVIGWKSKLNPFYGMHSKMLLVDDEVCIEGGRNIGDLYLLDNKWSDLDVYHEGEIAEVINPNLFASLWNEQIDLQRLKNKRLPLKSERRISAGETGTFMNSPQHKISDAVSNMTVYSIQNAKKEIDIANAYFISTPGIKNALTAAIQRGVRVRIYSNSMKSVDEPIVSIPIQKSLKEMFEAGAEIYLKDGQTLHTKIFKADDMSWYGSYNLHPRSGRYELEKITVTTDSKLTNELDQAQADSLRLGSRVRSVSELAYPSQPGMDILFGAIFNQL